MACYPGTLRALPSVYIYCGSLSPLCPGTSSVTTSDCLMQGFSALATLWGGLGALKKSQAPPFKVLIQSFWFGVQLLFFFFSNFIEIYSFFFFLASVGLCCCEKSFSSCSAQGSLWQLLLLRNMGSRASVIVAFALRHIGSSWTRD